MTPSPRELATQTAKNRRDQERLLQDLLGILDALDHACEHWQQAEQDHVQTLSTPLPKPTVSPTSSSVSFFQKCQQWLMFWRKEPPTSVGPAPSELAPSQETDGTREMISSAKEGVELIRRSLLDILQQRQVVPIEVNGQPFDPEQMYALGRQESAEVEENTVIQEVVRGYVWQNRILREAQVMVASKPSDPDER